MNFQKMIDDLIDQGLIDRDHKLTPKGHEQAEAIKKEYRDKIIAAEGRIRTKQEKVEWPTTGK